MSGWQRERERSAFPALEAIIPGLTNPEPGDKEAIFNTTVIQIMMCSGWGVTNPIQLTLSRNNMLGEIEHAKVLRNGSLLIVCKDNVQQMKAIRLKCLDGKKIVVSVMEDKMVGGVITGIPTVVTVEEIKESVVGTNRSTPFHRRG